MNSFARGAQQAATAWPRISIVTPSYNQGQFIEETIKSILSQGYPNLEYMVLDGGSTDGSVEIIKKYEPHLAYWRSGADDGPYAAIEEGFRRATGDVLAWLNSDDIYFPGAFGFIGQAFARCEVMQWLTTRMPGHINRFGDVSALSIAGVSKQSFADGRHLPGTGARMIGFIQQESTFFRRSLYERVGGLGDRFKLAADFALWARFLRTSDPHLCSVLLGAFRSHGSNRSGNMEVYRREGMAALTEFRQDIGWKPAQMRSGVINSRLARLRLVQKSIGYRGIGVQRGFENGAELWRTGAYRFA